MKGILISVLLFQSLFSIGQVNLVPNPSFEDTIRCPINGRLYNCKNWIQCGNTPDYDNGCLPVGNPFSVPNNNIGYQLPATGNAYCDLWTFSTTSLYREFIGVELIQPMIVGQVYHVSFKCSPGTLNGYSLLTNKLGLRFSTFGYDSLSTPPIDNLVHIYSDSIVSDTTNWTTISGYVTADSAYTFLTIGNFFDDAHTDTTSIIPLSFFGVYYIDDVEVSDTATGINESSEEGEGVHVIYIGNVLHFSSEKSITMIKIYNALGQLIIESSGTKNINNVEISSQGLVQGVYIAFVKTTSQNKSIKLFIH